MYLLGVKEGIHPCGNSGTLITHYKAEYKIRETADRFAAMHSLTEVFGLQLYPQRLCEMNNTDFVNYLRRNGKRYV